MQRTVMQDFMFSDGTLLKKGAIVGVASRPTHLDGGIFPAADTFDGFRFYGKDGTERGSLVSTGENALHFGTGRHAWYVHQCCSTTELTLS